jgi:hexosaminidase
MRVPTVRSLARPRGAGGGDGLRLLAPLAESAIAPADPARRAAPHAAVRRLSMGLVTSALAGLGTMAAAQNPPAVLSARPAPAVVPAAAVAVTPAHHLMPVPASLQFGAGRLPIDSTFTVAVGGVRDARLTGAVYRMVRRLEARLGVSLTRLPAGATGVWPAAGAAPGATLVVTALGAGLAVQTPAEDESYTLEVTPSQASLRAPTVVGILRGLETFLQLVDGGQDGFFLPAVGIQDRPRFPWRGILVDVSRHFEPVAVIERNLDAMAAVKFNVLHWHLSDDQGFRVESRRFPRLHESGSDGLYYTQDQVREVVAYARDRGIRVVPEFDMPGHATAWFVGYPEYASAPGPYEIERRMGVFDPTFDPTREETYRFLDRFIGEMAALFPDPYWHVGGDENSGVQWDRNPRIRAFKEGHGWTRNEALQTYFNQRLLPILAKYHKQMVGWDEILQPGLSTTSLIQSWQGRASLDSAAHRGYSTILSSGWYLDHQRSAEYHYTMDPLPATSMLSAEEAARILGGEACLWAEHVGPETIDSRLWPRAAAIAERLWSPREVTDVADMYRRLGTVSRQLEEVGVTHESHTGRMLRRIAAGAETDALEALLEVAQPAYFGERSQLQRTTQITPLTHLVDAARPDPPSRFRVGALVDSLLADPGHAAGRTALAAVFLQWRHLRAELRPLAESSPLAAEALPAAEGLEDLGNIGLEAIAYLVPGSAPPDGWLARVTPALDGADRPLGLLRLPVAPAIRRLAVAAAEPRR